MSRWMNGGSPTTCSVCGNPFPIRERRIECVDVDGEYVCNTQTCIDAAHEIADVPSFVRKGRKLAS